MTPLTPYYEDGGIQVYLGDCRILLPQLPPADVMLTDPPYDEETHTGARRVKAGGGAEAIPIRFAPMNLSKDLAGLLDRTTRWALMFCSLEMLGDYRTYAQDWWVRSGFWDRLHGAPQITGDRPAHPGDGIAIMHRPLSAGRKGPMRWNGGGNRGIWRYPVLHGVERGSSRVHPTQKPQGLIEALIVDFTDPGELIIDPYAGSLTTAVAARRLGRRCICIEGEEEWCHAGVQRLAQGVLDLSAS